MSTQRKIIFSIQEDPEIVERIDERAIAEGTSRAAVIRKAIRILLASSHACPHTYPQDKGAQP